MGEGAGVLILEELEHAKVRPLWQFKPVIGTRARLRALTVISRRQQLVQDKSALPLGRGKHG